MDELRRLDGEGQAPGRFVLVALVAFALDLWMRWPGLGNVGFASHDVAGMTYNGMLIGLGELPYVDSVELKAPGGFYLAAAVQKLMGGPGVASVTAFVQAANVLASGVLVLLMWMAWRAWGLPSATLAGAVYLAGSGFLDSMDANYVTWANAWAVAAVGVAWLRQHPRELRLGSWLLVGVFAGAATLSKRPVGVVLVACGLWVFWSSSDQRTRLLRCLGLLGGVALVHLPLLMHYASAGETRAFLEGYVFNEWGGAYVGRKAPPLWLGMREGLAATLHFMALPLALAGLSWGGRASSGRAEQDRLEGVRCRGLLAWALLAWIATFVGWRFYKGYFVPLLPPLALLAAHPSGVLSLLTRAKQSRRARVVLAAAIIGLGFLGTRQALLVHAMRMDRARPHDVGGRRIADYLGTKLEEGDRIWVWGWHLWDVYTYTGTPSASRIYKSLGLLTPPNDDTWRGGGSRLRFVDGAPAKTLLEDFAEHPPAFIVLGSTVPQREFKALRSLLRRDYQRVRGPRIGKVQYWERKERPAASN
jgi:hypothetical protein